ncbi:MAG: hypothetical protein OEX08_00730 [Candidatus Nomurabacteria bacterium]|nr:hypothetical protein [Candidatus Nomurabacteria bacterium]
MSQEYDINIAKSNICAKYRVYQTEHPTAQHKYKKQNFLSILRKDLVNYYIANGDDPEQKFIHGFCKEIAKKFFINALPCFNKKEWQSFQQLFFDKKQDYDRARKREREMARLGHHGILNELTSIGLSSN